MAQKMELTDGLILLRPYRMSDVEPLHEAVHESIADLSKWFPWCHAEHSLEESRRFVETRSEAWEAGRDYGFAVFDYRGGRYIGNCSLFEVRAGDKTASASYWVRTSQTNGGIATAALRLLAEFGFNELRLNRIEIIVATENRASLRVAEKSGAKREGVLRNRFPVGGRVHDAVMFSLIPQDLG
jgi:ribosomal-protein-serine acetyltransferase